MKPRSQAFNKFGCLEVPPGCSLAFRHRDDAIAPYVPVLFHEPKRPADLDNVGLCGLAEPEMQAEVTLRVETRLAQHILSLTPRARYHPDRRADGAAVRLRPDQFQLQPVIPVACVVPQQR